VEELHVAVPLTLPHTVVHPPQWFMSVSANSQPLNRLLSQFPHPVEQVIPQLPDEQVAAPLVELHAFAHEPQ